MSRYVPAALLAGGLAATAAALPGGSGQALSNHRSTGNAYALSIGRTMTSDNVTVDDYVRLHERRSGDFLWFRRDSKAWLITDAPTLEQAAAVFAPLRALEPEQKQLQSREEALEKEERDLDRQEEAIDRQMDLASGDDEDDEGNASAQVANASDADQEELHGRLQELQARQREFSVREQELDDVERSLDAREDAIERESEAKLWNLIDATVKKGVAKPI